MARKEVGYNPGAEALQVTASPNIQTVREREAPDASLNPALRLAEALDSSALKMQRFNTEWEAKKLAEQGEKIDWYVEQFRRDNQGGAVSEAQVKKRFPETVPVIASRIAEGVGKKAGSEAIQSVIQEIEQNDELRLDSAKRDAFIKEKRAELLSSVGSDNEFYGAGYVRAMDAQLNQWQTNWTNETAKYHEKVQADDFSSQVTDALIKGEDLNVLDEKWKTTSSLNNLERNKIVVETAINHAFASDDPKVLDQVPQKFLNADTKEKLAKAKIEITNVRFSNFRNGQAFEQAQREEATRKSKVEIIDKLQRGDVVNPADYKDNPEAFNYALTMKDQGVISEAQSTSNANRVRNEIIADATINATKSEGEMQDDILKRKDLNPAQKKALVDELPKLREGANLMKDPMVESSIATRITPILKSFDDLKLSDYFTVKGMNPKVDVMKQLETNIRNEFIADYEDSKAAGKPQWPTGRRKLDIINSQMEKAEKQLQMYREMVLKPQGQSQAPTPKATAPAAPATPQATGKKVQVGTLPDGRPIYKIENK